MPKIRNWLQSEDFEGWKLWINGRNFHGIRSECNELKCEEVQNYDLKKLCKINVFQLVLNGQYEKSRGPNIEDSGLKDILHKYETVFRTELPPGLPPIRSADHEIETDKNSKPPHRLL